MRPLRIQLQERDGAPGLSAGQVAVVVSLALSLAGSAGQAVAQGRSEWLPPAGQHCGPLPIPARLPSVSELLDSTIALSVLASDTAFRTGFELLAIGIDAAGAVRQVHIIEADLPPEPARRLATVLAGLIDPQPVGAPGQLRLAVELGASPHLSVSRSEFCRLGIRPGQLTTTIERIGTVRIENGDVASVSVNQSWQALDAGVAGTANRWLVTVDASGRAVEATPLTGIAPQLAASARAAVLKLKFNPALVDRVPVTMTDMVTVGGP